MELGWDEIPFPLLLADSDGQVTSGNARAGVELGRPMAEILGLSLDEVLPQPAFPPWAADSQVRSTPDGLVRLQFRAVNVAGVECQAITWLLLEKVTAAAAAAAPSGSLAKAPPGPAPTILVAEDEESIRDICQRVLSDAGYEVVVAADGQAAIDALRERGIGIDLVLADVVMPGAGGEAIYEFLRQSKLETPIVYTSGYSLRSSPAGFLNEEGVVLLRKPYTLAELLTVVREALTRANEGNSP